MQQIADWLKKLGMSEYAERFAESDIDTSVLRDLTDQDLKELGVSLGHRRKMLRAIAEVAGANPTSPPPALTEPKPQDTAERRQVTVMFSDLVGVGRGAAQVILAEIGPDMSAFPTAGHLLSWAGVVPRLDESAGKRRSTRVRHGAPWLKPVLVQCAWGAARAKGTYLQAQFFRLKARRGPKKAAIAVAASILTAVYHMLKDGTFYQDLGADYLVKRDPARTVCAFQRS